MTEIITDAEAEATGAHASHPADWSETVWAVLFTPAPSDGRGPAHGPHLCWADPNSHWGPAFFLTKRQATEYIRRRFAWIKDPRQNRAGHRTPKPVRVRVAVRVETAAGNE